MNIYELINKFNNCNKEKIMEKLLQILIIIFVQITVINCIVSCNKETNLPPFLEYHCSGLEIDNNTNKEDKYCCLWTFIDNSTQKEINRCSSISEIQFKNLTQYIQKKRETYINLNIKCVEDQYTYCSNVVLDEEPATNCKEMHIYDSDDMYCCRWTFEDSDNYLKKNDYCASINEFEYMNIKKYVQYKNDAKEQRYNNLKIDCKGKYLSLLIIFRVLFILVLLIL